MVERGREINGQISTERAFYIGSSGIATAETFAKAARGHWGVENRLHWALDVTFWEDDCRVRKGHAPQNLSALHKFALSLLCQDNQYPKRSLRGRRKTTDRLPNYRASLLRLVPLGQMRIPCAAQQGAIRRLASPQFRGITCLQSDNTRQEPKCLSASTSSWRRSSSRRWPTTPC